MKMVSKALEGVLARVEGAFICNHNNLASLAYFPEGCEAISIRGNTQLGEHQNITEYWQIRALVEQQQLKQNIEAHTGQRPVHKI